MTLEMAIVYMREQFPRNQCPRELQDDARTEEYLALAYYQPTMLSTKTDFDGTSVVLDIQIRETIERQQARDAGLSEEQAERLVEMSLKNRPERRSYWQDGQLMLPENVSLEGKW